MKIKIAFLLILSCHFGFIMAQSQEKFTDNLKLGVNYHRGYNLPEYSSFLLKVNSPIQSFDLTISKETIGNTSWEQLFNYPEYGLSLFYTTLGDAEVFGNELAFTYFFKIYLLDREKFKLYSRVGIGLSYVTKKYHPETNPSNIAVGSHLNIHFNTQFGGAYKLSEKVNLNAGLSFDHLSNANTSEPNIGMNSLTAFVGLSYYLGSRKDRKQTELPKHEPKNSLYLFGSVGGKHLRSLSGKYFLANSLSLEYLRESGRIFHIGAGLDVFYDTSVKTFLEDDNKSFKAQDNFQTGFHISQTLRYNRFSLNLQQGVYVGLINKVEDKIMYNRGIIKYNFSENISIRLAMKSHLHILDYPEIGIGFKLK